MKHRNNDADDRRHQRANSDVGHPARVIKLVFFSRRPLKFIFIPLKVLFSKPSSDELLFELAADDERAAAIDVVAPCGICATTLKDSMVESSEAWAKLPPLG